jgi:hypothetical protein
MHLELKKIDGGFLKFLMLVLIKPLRLLWHVVPCIFFCQLQGMPELVVHDVQTRRDPFVSFASMHISVPREGERAKAIGEEM